MVLHERDAAGAAIERHDGVALGDHEIRNAVVGEVARGERARVGRGGERGVGEVEPDAVAEKDANRRRAFG